jgi:hypothetical protein
LHLQNRETTFRRSFIVSVASWSACPRKVDLSELLSLETHGKITFSSSFVSTSTRYYPCTSTSNLPFRGEHPTICSNICLGCLVHPPGFGIVYDSSLQPQHYPLYYLICSLQRPRLSLLRLTSMASFVSTGSPKLSRKASPGFNILEQNEGHEKSTMNELVVRLKTPPHRETPCL